MKLTTTQAMKNTAGIWLNSARNIARIMKNGAGIRDSAKIHDEYTRVQKDWESLDAPVLVKSNDGLEVITHRAFREQYARIIEEAISLTKAKRVIEFGCGEGLNYGLIKTNAAICGFDLVPERIRRARERFPDANLWVGDATVPQGEPDSFDLAFACHAVEQMQGVWREAITQMHRIAPHVLLLEPFYERKSIHGKLHSRVSGYFRGTLEDVKRIGFTVVREFQVPFVEPFNTTTAVLLKRHG